MAKNTYNNAFRKIDVDQYNEDLYRDEDSADPHSPPPGPDESQVSQLLGSGRNIEALRYVISNAPVGSKSHQLKDSALQTMMKVLLSIRSSEIDKAINTLNSEEVDLLMKYIYRGFEIPSEGSSGHLLTWHDKLYNVGGVGSIVRVLTDRKRV